MIHSSLLFRRLSTPTLALIAHLITGTPAKSHRIVLTMLPWLVHITVVVEIVVVVVSIGGQDPAGIGVPGH